VLNSSRFRPKDESDMTWQFTLTGLLIGALVGLTGMGGGSLLTPILVIVFGFKPTYAVGTDILHGAVFKSFGAVRCRQLGTVHARLAAWMFIGSGPMSLAGVVVAKTFVKRGVQASNAPFILQRQDKIRATIIGAVFGFVVGLTSVGSGTFFGLIMVMIYPLTIPKIVGTDIFHAAALLWVAGFGHLVQGNVDLHATAWLLLGSIPGILIASKFTVKIPDDALRLGLALVLALSGLKLLEVPEANWIIAGGLGVGAIALTAFGIRAWVARPRPAPAGGFD
jgi:uncharacterized protein